MKSKFFVLKYDKNKNLYNYIEKDSKFKINNYYNYNYKNDSVVKYDSINKIRIFSQFESPGKLVHLFEAGESWIKAVSIESDSYNVQFPKIKKQFALNSENQIVKFSIHQQLLEQWR